MKVGIIGASGYTGGELLRLLARHRECEVACATSRTFAGKSISAAHPNLRGIFDLKFENPDVEAVASCSDFVFVAAPHGASMKIVPQLLNKGVKVVDLSGDFRFKDVSTYEKYYKLKHEHPEIKAAYGLPELHRAEIKNAKLVANPGCYPTGAILALAPIIKAGLIDVEKIACDAKSGVSGAGAEPTHTVHYASAAESVLPYKLASHRHAPEIEQELRSFNPAVKISFVPHLVPVIRGIETTIHCFLKREVSGEQVQKLYSEFYKSESFVRVLGAGEVPRLSAVRGSNFADIGGFEVDEERGRVIIVSAIDNLTKGAAGQAVQNMNIMQGFDEREGLREAAVHP